MVRKICWAWFLLACAAVAAAQERLSISSQELDRLLRERKVVVLDARSATDYEQGHIPGARSLPFTATYEDLKTNGRVLPLPKAQAMFSSVGLRREDLVVVYDAGPMMHAARVLWALEVYGHERVRLLDGGLKAWQIGKQQLTKDAPSFGASQYVPTVNPQRLATRLTTLVASRNPVAYEVIDARPEPHYEGRESEARRFGHIPGARSIAVAKNLAEDGVHLKSRDQLIALYKDLPKNKKIITYCSFGLASALEYLVLRDLGFDVANYDASWKEWGNDGSLPIVEPAQIR